MLYSVITFPFPLSLQKLEQNICICELTPQRSDWICKIQIVDICGPTKSKGKRGEISKYDPSRKHVQHYS